MGTSSHLVAAIDPGASRSSTSSSSPLPIQPFSLNTHYPPTTGTYISHQDILQDGGIRYVIRRHLMGLQHQHHHPLEDHNFIYLYDRKEVTGDVTLLCPYKSPTAAASTEPIFSTGSDLIFMKAHKYVLVKSSSFFQHYFEPFLEHQTMPFVILPTIFASTMKLMLQLFYTNQIILKFDEMNPFWSAASILQIRQVEPIYKWIFYIETLEPVPSEDNPIHPASVHFESPLPFHFAHGGTVPPENLDQVVVGPHQQTTSTTTTGLVQQIVPVTVSIAQDPAQSQPIVILRALSTPTQIPLPSCNTIEGGHVSPVFYMNPITHNQSHSTAGQNMTPPPPGTPASPTAGDIAMAMLSANPEQRCRLYYENQLDSPDPADQSILLSTSSSSTMAPTSPPSLANNMVMCPVCLTVLEQENFAVHKLTCKIFVRASSTMQNIDDQPPLPPSPPPLPPPPPPPPPPPSPPSSPRPREFSCLVCGKTFVTRYGLNAHKPAHSKKPPNPQSVEKHTVENSSCEQSSSSSPNPPKMKKPSFTIPPLQEGHPTGEKRRPPTSPSPPSPSSEPHHHQ